MNQSKQFIKIAKQFTDEAKRNIVYKPYDTKIQPRSLSVIQFEAMKDTKLSKKLLKEMLITKSLIKENKKDD